MRLADCLEGRHAGPQILRRDLDAIESAGGEVERPDLHRRDAHLQQFRRELVRPGHESLQVLVTAAVDRRASRQAKILWPDVRRLRDVVRPRAGIVDADIVPSRAAEQRVEWLAGRLPDNVPERHVDRRGGADLGAGAAEADIRPCRAGQRLDAARVRADEGGRDPLVDVGVDRGTAEPALANADQALVSMDANAGRLYRQASQIAAMCRWSVPQHPPSTESRGMRSRKSR